MAGRRPIKVLNVAEKNSVAMTVTRELTGGRFNQSPSW